MDHIVYQIFHNISSISPINLSKIENRITSEIKTGLYLAHLTPETMKSLRSTKSKITKDENCENVPYLEITEVILFHCNIVNNNYQQDSTVIYIFVRNKSLRE